MPATSLQQLLSEMSPEDLAELQSMRLGDFGYDDIQVAARGMVQSGKVMGYTTAVEQWIAEKP